MPLMASRSVSVVSGSMVPLLGCGFHASMGLELTFCHFTASSGIPLPSYVLIPPQQWSSNHSGHDLLDWPSLDYDFATAYSMTLHENLHFTDPEAMCGWLRHLPRRLQEGLCFPKSLVPEESSLGYDAIWGELVWGSGPFKFAALCQDSLSKSAFFPRKARPYCLLTPPWDVNWSNRHW